MIPIAILAGAIPLGYLVDFGKLPPNVPGGPSPVLTFTATLDDGRTETVGMAVGPPVRFRNQAADTMAANGWELQKLGQTAIILTGHDGCRLRSVEFTSTGPKPTGWWVVVPPEAPKK